MNILALIPARSGSRGIPDKNIRIFRDRPLLAHSIQHALRSTLINRTIVSTDSFSYADLAKQYGAEAPFLRPSEIAGDLSADIEVFLHAIEWLKENEGYVPDICVHLRPTYPIRRIEDIDSVIQILIENPKIDSVRTVSPAPDTPFKMWFRDNKGYLTPVIKTDLREAYNLPRQCLPPVFLQNACIDVVRTRVINEKKSMTGEMIFGYLMEENFDIDTEAQFREACFAFDGNRACNDSGEAGIVSVYDKKRFCFDIDGVIATIVPDNRYDLAGPMKENISLINSLYDKGNHIILFTARGSLTGLDWVEVTKRQMEAWGVKHHELLFRKPASDFYIDDKMISEEGLRKLARVLLAEPFTKGAENE